MVGTLPNGAESVKRKAPRRLVSLDLLQIRWRKPDVRLAYSIRRSRRFLH
jgi:hypothetical protein